MENKLKMARRLPTIEEIEKEYKEWAVDLLKVRFDLKPEAFDVHHKNNYSFENCTDCLWNDIKGSIEELLWFKENQLTEDEALLQQCLKWMDLYYSQINKTKKTSKKTTEKFVKLLTNNGERQTLPIKDNKGKVVDRAYIIPHSYLCDCAKQCCVDMKE